MSTLKVDAVTAKSTNTNIAATGTETGKVALGRELIPDTYLALYMNEVRFQQELGSPKLQKLKLDIQNRSK